MSLLVDFGAIVKHLRLQRGWTQRALAERSRGVTAQQISSFETSQVLPMLETADRILDALECDGYAFAEAGAAVRAAREGRPVPRREDPVAYYVSLPVRHGQSAEQAITPDAMAQVAATCARMALDLSLKGAKGREEEGEELGRTA